MSTAAQQLGYARSTVTGHIQGLERSLGAKLLDRRQSHALTASGAALLEHVEEILTSMDRARTAVAAAEEGRGMPLRLGATESLCAYRMPVFLRMLGREMPGLRVEVETATVAQLCQQAQSGRLSVVMINGSSDLWGSGALGSGALSRRELWEDRPLMVGTPAAVASPKRVLLTGPGCVYREIAESDFLRRIPDAEPMQVGSMEGVKSAVLAGLGVGLLPSVAVQSALANGQLMILPLRTDRKVITAVAWNDQTCPASVASRLGMLGRKSSPGVAA